MMREIKYSKDILKEKREQIKQQKQEIIVLKQQMEIKDRRIHNLEIKTNIIEQCSKKNNAIITDVEQRTFAVAVSDEVAGPAVTHQGAEAAEDKKMALAEFSTKVLKQ